MSLHRLSIVFLLAGLLMGCGDDDGNSGAGGGGGSAPAWQTVHQDLDGALLSVWGSSASDVWIAGADARDGTGPLVLHYDGSSWERVLTGQSDGDLWWVFGFDGGPLFFGGGGGVILKYEAGAFSLMSTPGNDTVFGLWGSGPSDMWAVGGSFDKSGFAWRLNGDTWEEEASLPAAVVADAAIWKVFGRSGQDVWLVGSGGVSFHWDGSALAQQSTGVGSSLFTVHGNASRYVAVGGLASGIIVENDGNGWVDALGAGTFYGLTGVALHGDEGGYAVGQYGSVMSRSAGGWQTEDAGLSTTLDLHGVWVDPSGGVWAVGGRTASFPLVEGLLVHKGEMIGSAGL